MRYIDMNDHMFTRVSQPNMFFLKIKRSNPFLWYLGVGLKDPKRIFDLGKFQVVHKAVKNLTSIINKGQNRRGAGTAVA